MLECSKTILFYFLKHIVAAHLFTDCQQLCLGPVCMPLFRKAQQTLIGQMDQCVVIG